LLRCPSTHQPVDLANPSLLADFNRTIASRRDGSEVRNAAGSTVPHPLEAALVRRDGSAFYPVYDGIPVMLVEEAILLPLASRGRRGSHGRIHDPPP
jgi:uncharacterized protein YbaR (Trm112 family)